VARLRLFGPAREQAGLHRLDIPGGTVGAVLDAAAVRFGEGFAQIVGTSRIWVNGDTAGRNDRVDEEDEVAVIPPVSGG
jgi:molybdopterin converting factor small subunit